MAIFDLYSKRQKRLRGEVPDVYTYDDIPKPVRVQIVHIWKDSLGDEDEYYRYDEVKQSYKFIVETLRREYGVFKLVTSRYETLNNLQELVEFFLDVGDTGKVIDTIELSFKVIDKFTRNYTHRYPQAKERANQSISELNDRFREHGIGYQFEGAEIMRVDSQLLHMEAVKPALHLLSAKEYVGAQQEFLSAYEHYRHGKHKEALNDALKALESTMKTICDKRSWKYDPRDTSKQLIDICFQKDLIPHFWQQHMGGLRSLLEGGVPTGRNKLSGHGQGSKPTTVPEHIVSYILHMTGASIVFLLKSEQSMK